MNEIAMNPSVTAVMLTCDRVERCLDCVKHTAESIQRTAESVLVINNGEKRLTLPDKHAGVSCRVINIGRNAGVKARNLSFDGPHGDVLLMLDDDAYISEQSVQHMVSIFHNDPTVGAVSFPVRNGISGESCLLPTIFHGCACGFRASALQQIGGYPDNFRYYGEEYDIAFRLYQAGYRIVLSDDADESGSDETVFHARDGGGRSKDRIMRLLIRNNTYLWCSALPLSAILPSIMDTVQRYWLVARRERAVRGFAAGLLSVPYSILRGLLRRRPLEQSLFGDISLLTHLEHAIDSLPPSFSRDVIICGVGKFPRLWLNLLNTRGIRVNTLLDRNICWQDQKLAGRRVLVSDEVPGAVSGDSVYITGLSSMTENAYWQKALEGSGFTAASTIRRTATSSENGRIDLLKEQRITFYERTD